LTRWKAALHTEQLVDRKSVEAVLLTLHDGTQHGRGNPLRHQVGVAEVLVFIAQQHTVRFSELAEETVTGGQALVVQLRVVSRDTERLQHPERAEELGALQHDLQHGAAEEQVDIDRLEIPGVGQEQPAGDDHYRRQDAGELENLLQHVHGTPGISCARPVRAPGSLAPSGPAVMARKSRGLRGSGNRPGRRQSPSRPFHRRKFAPDCVSAIQESSRMSRTTDDAQFVPLRVAVITISDSRTTGDDTSGDYLAAELEREGHRLAQRKIVKDDRYVLRAEISALIADAGVDVVLTTGSTGLTGRDIAPEALEPLFDKAIEGFGELFRAASVADIGAATIQSRAFAGLANGTIIFCMPGSPGACKTAWEEVIRPQLDARTRPCNLANLKPRFLEQ
jgi:molybdenum cofactor biosynthesis protein B